MKARRLERPLRKLRNSIRDLTKNPRAKEVHRLRTEARRVETLAAAWAPDGAEPAQALLTAIRPVRKIAGRVRDADVLTGNLLSLPQSLHSDSFLQLIEDLRRQRKDDADALRRAAGRRRKVLDRAMEQYARLLRTACAGTLSDGVEGRSAFEKAARAVAAKLTGELCGWPKFSAENLHEFRLKAKALYTLLLLFGDADGVLLKALEKVKERVGDWHDWQQLAEVAAKKLDADEDAALLKRMKKSVEQKRRRALAAANALQKRAVQMERGNRAGKPPAGEADYGTEEVARPRGPLRELRPAGVRSGASQAA